MIINPGCRRAIETCKHLEESRKKELHDKELATERRLQELEQQKITEKKQRAKEIEDKEAYRKAARDKAENDLEERKMHLLDIQSQMGNAFEKVMSERENQIAHKREEARLKALDTADNVERLKRQQEYKKTLATKKMQEDEVRASMIAAKRAEIQVTGACRPYSPNAIDSIPDNTFGTCFGTHYSSDTAVSPTTNTPDCIQAQRKKMSQDSVIARQELAKAAQYL